VSSRDTRADLVADVHATVLDDVGAQAAAVYERAQNGTRRVAIDHPARLT
jgi:hypothetical protein